MSIRGSMVQLGTTGQSPLLIGNCKCEWAGAEIYGEEAIGEAFRAAPMVAHEEAVLLDCAQHAAWFSGDSMLFADLYDGRIGRLWRLGPGETPATEPAASVAFDPDLRQPRGGVYARAEDHPLLATAHLPAIEAAATGLIAAPAGARQHRARAVLVRAFSTGECAAALFAVHRLTGGEVRSSGFGFEAIALVEGSPRIVKHTPVSAPWTPRL